MFLFLFSRGILLFWYSLINKIVWHELHFLAIQRYPHHFEIDAVFMFHVSKSKVNKRSDLNIPIFIFIYLFIYLEHRRHLSCLYSGWNSVRLLSQPKNLVVLSYVFSSVSHFLWMRFQLWFLYLFKYHTSHLFVSWQNLPNPLEIENQIVVF